MEAPETWHFPYFDEAMEAAIGERVLLRRVPPRPEDVRGVSGVLARAVARRGPMAALINGVPKFVASRTLDEVAWENSTLLGPDLAGEVTSLKELPGKDIAVTRSATLVRSLFAEGLLDELGLMIHPIVLGRGVRLFEDGRRTRLWSSSRRRRTAPASST